MPFQTSVSLYQAPGIPGDWASANPYASAVAGEGAFVAGTGGLTIARFAWVNSAGATVSNAGTGVPTGFVSRQFQAQITAFPPVAGALIPAGREVTVHSRGDFWALASGTVTRGQKVFASNTDGTISTGAAGATVSGSTETAFTAASSCAAGEVFMMTSWA